MKKRILFVDDEPLILQGMQRQLRSMREEWDMEFAESGAQALAALEKESFDVVVSDMRMPGMDGAELMNEVMKRHPQTVRLILSGYADHDLIMKCVGSTHQCLSKPCEPDTLRAAIMHATSLDLSLQDGPVRELVSRMDRLPSLPTLYVELVDALGDPDVSLDEVASIVAQDIGMTAKILKLVNSAFFGLSREIANSHEAVVYLGHETIKSLVLTMKVFSQFDTSKLQGLSMDELWPHSLSTAAAARKIGRATQADAKLMDEAFAAGMLHDTGRLVLGTNLTDKYAQVVQLARDKQIALHEAEREMFNVTHAEVGGYLLGLWGLPGAVVEAVTFHHYPARSASHTFCPLTAVHVANVLVQETDTLWKGLAPLQLDLEYLQALSLADRLDDWRATIHEPVPQGESR